MPLVSTTNTLGTFTVKMLLTINSNYTITGTTEFSVAPYMKHCRFIAVLYVTILNQSRGHERIGLPACYIAIETRVLPERVRNFQYYLKLPSAWYLDEKRLWNVKWMPMQTNTGQLMQLRKKMLRENYIFMTHVRRWPPIKEAWLGFQYQISK